MKRFFLLHFFLVLFSGALIANTERTQQQSDFRIVSDYALYTNHINTMCHRFEKNYLAIEQALSNIENVENKCEDYHNAGDLGVLDNVIQSHALYDDSPHNNATFIYRDSDTVNNAPPFLLAGQYVIEYTGDTLFVVEPLADFQIELKVETDLSCSPIPNSNQETCVFYLTTSAPLDNVHSKILQHMNPECRAKLNVSRMFTCITPAP